MGVGMVLPDRKMIQVLMSLPRRNTEALIGGVIGALEEAGIQLVDSTFLLRRLIPKKGILSRRKPNKEESKDIDYGRSVVREIARLDLGQTVVGKRPGSGGGLKQWRERTRRSVGPPAWFEVDA